MSDGVRIAVDTGGTFTDFQIFNKASGETFELKTPTTPEDPTSGMVRGLESAAERFDFRLDTIDSITHGTTIATNALLQGNLPRGGLITTEGFTDVLEIGRHVRRDVYSLAPETRPPLVARRDRFALPERMAASGVSTTPVDRVTLANIAEHIGQRDIETIAVCLINAHINPAHEIEVGDWLRSHFPGMPISLSNEISPEIREYERTSTVVLNALLRPILETYIRNLEARLADIGVSAKLYIIQSNGGVCSPRTAATEPVRLFLSGPSGGAAAARHMAATLDVPNMIAMDIGGTSTDVSIVHDGETSNTNESEVAGCALRLPMIEIRTIGAGGGSIAAVDVSGQLHIGPESAGADPGPAAYGRGGLLATVTDAHVVLGRLDPGAIFESEITLDAEASRRVVRSSVAEPLGVSLEVAAEGLTRLTSSNMANAIRLSLFEKGMDPLDFCLLSFGGGGGLHAAQVAEEIGIRRVIFPRSASAFSAYGLLWSNMAHDFVTACFGPARAMATEVSALLSRLMVEARARLTDDDVPAEVQELQALFDLRYRGQAFELSIPVAADPSVEKMLDDAIADFHDLHKQRYAYSQPEAIVNIVAVRVRAIGVIRHAADAVVSASAARPALTRRVYLDGAWREIAVLAFDALSVDNAVAGPAIIEQPYASIFLPAGWRAQATAFQDIQAERVA